MRSKSGPHSSAEAHVREIRRATRKKHSAEERIRIVLEGLARRVLDRRTVPDQATPL